MKNKIYRSLVILIFTLGLYTASIYNPPKQLTTSNTDTFSGAIETVNKQNNNVSSSISNTEISIVGNGENIDRLEMVGEIEVQSEPLVFPDSYYDPETEEYREEEFWDDMELVALVCVAEAEAESELGKRLVIDTIFNRAESPYFPNTIYGVVYDNSQYSCVWNGRLEKIEYDEYIANLVLEEFNNRTNSEVIFFKTDGYFGFGTPIMKEGSHYFSGR